jgi:4-hydroxy-4-methyl-2-oxoglutarate aldolase
MTTLDSRREPGPAAGCSATHRIDGPPPVPDLHPERGVIVTAIPRPEPATVTALHALYTGLVCDHLGKHGALHAEIKPLFPGARLCGPALTVVGANWRLRFMAADLAQPGDVIVIVPDALDNACFGDMTATRWQTRGIARVVIDGATRDVAGIRALGFPVFARRVTPRIFHCPAGADHGAVNVPVCCGGILIQPGDILLGDDDGVVVIPRLAAVDIAAIASAYLV